MGGMFDPIHKGHLNCALSALDQFGMDEVRMIPCGVPVHRAASVGSNDHRLAMLSLATQQNTKLVVDDRECESSAASYTVNTLRSLKAEFPKAQLFLLLGVDAFNLLPTWYQWQHLFDFAHLIVAARPGWQLEPEASYEFATLIEKRRVNSFAEMIRCSQGNILFHRFTLIEAGSTEIRQLIKNKQTVSHLLPDAVEKYITNNNLYT